LVRMDRHGYTRRDRDRLYSCAVTRSLVSPILARVGMGCFGRRNDGVRLPDYSLVPTIDKICKLIAGGTLPRRFCSASC
jgi:hypothetical protein